MCAFGAGENESNALLREINKQRQVRLVLRMQCSSFRQLLQCSLSLQQGTKLCKAVLV
jgi:hypothetical protein